MAGSFRRRGKSKTWSFVIDLPRGADGARRQKTYGGFRTKKLAEEEYVKVKEQLRNGTFVEANNLTLGAYLDHWLKNYAETNVAQLTYDTWSQLIRTNIVPQLGEIQLARLQPMQLQEFYTWSLAEGRKDGKGGLSRRTVLHLHRLLFQAFEQAVKWQLLIRNPAAAVEPPRPEKKIRPIYSDEQMRELLELAAESWLYLPVLLGASTGMRRGEILGLRWKDVQLRPSRDPEVPSRGTIHIQQSLKQSRTRGLIFGPTKREKSDRSVELAGFVVDELVQHRAAQAQTQLVMGAAYEDHGLVVCQDDGRPRTPDNLSHGWAKLLERLNLPKIHFHDLRHSHATSLLKAGENPKVVQERMGHSSFSTTMDLYGHVVPGMQAEAARRTQEALRPRKSSLRVVGEG